MRRILTMLRGAQQSCRWRWGDEEAPRAAQLLVVLLLGMSAYGHDVEAISESVYILILTI